MVDKLNDLTGRKEGSSNQSQEVIALLSEKAEEKGKSLRPFTKTDHQGEVIRAYGFSLNIGSGEGPAGNLTADYWAGTEVDPGLFQLIHLTHRHPRVETISPEDFYTQFNKFLEEPSPDMASPSKSLSRLRELLTEQ